MKKWILLALLCYSIPTLAQNREDSTTAEWQAGVELDILPFALGGYFGASWIGKDRFRLRVLTANVHKPDITTDRAFTHHHIYAYALVADYFLKPVWKGWWVGTGPVFWQSSIISKSSGAEAGFHNWLWNGSVGHHFPIKKRFYCSPWAGLSFRIAGNKNTAVGPDHFTLPVVNPEISVKMGFIF